MSGLSGFKDRMKAIQDNIKAENDKAEKCDKDRETLHRTYCRTMGKQQQLKDKIIDKEEEIERTMKKIKDLEDRLRQKEEFLKEAAVFNTKLKSGNPEEGARADIERKLREYKILYNQTNEKYMQAKEHKINLEERFEHIEDKNKDVYKKVEELNRELETCLREEGRRAEQCKQSMDAAFKNEKNCIGVQRMLDDLTKRTKDATKKVAQNQKRKTKIEEEIDETNYERRVVEATIKEILRKS